MSKKSKNREVKCRATFQSCDVLNVPGEGTVTIAGRVTKTHKAAIKSVSRTAKIYRKIDAWGGGR